MLVYSCRCCDCVGQVATQISLSLMFLATCNKLPCVCPTELSSFCFPLR